MPKTSSPTWSEYLILSRSSPMVFLLDSFAAKLSIPISIYFYIKPSVTHGSPEKHSTNLRRCERQRHDRSDDHRILHPRAFGFLREFLANSRFLCQTSQASARLDTHPPSKSQYPRRPPYPR